MSLKIVIPVIFLVFFNFNLSFVESKLLENYSNSLTKLVNHFGYNIDTHQLVTTDGYFVNVYRLYGKDKKVSSKSYKKGCPVKPAIFLSHSIYLNSIEFLLLGPGKTFAFHIVDRGYDVWLGDVRAGRFTLAHTSLPITPFNYKYWDFTAHEVATIDVPLMIDYVIKMTKSKKIFYGGFSSGTTYLSILLSEKPEYNEKLIHASFIGAAIWCSNHTDTLFKAFENNFFTLVSYPQTLPTLPLAQIHKFFHDRIEKSCKTKLNSTDCLKAIADRSEWIAWAEHGKYTDKVKSYKILLTDYE